MAVKLKNYSTEVPAIRSIENIEKLLVDFGAKNTMKEYAPIKDLPGQFCIAISFIIEIEGMKLPFKLPAKIHNVIKWLKGQRPKSSEKAIAEQAMRIAWKQQHEILHLQLGQIEMDQIEKLEMLFPYLYDIKTNKTYYEQVKAGGFKALMPSANN